MSARKCPNCKQRKLVSGGFGGFEAGKRVFLGICFGCFGAYKIINGQWIFVEFSDRNDFEDF
jgi:hypothetical protein